MANLGKIERIDCGIDFNFLRCELLPKSVSIEVSAIQSIGIGLLEH